ncbi:acetylcholinesterase-1-like isoform X1 [Dermacentor albipictus]|uniref:acetylcholinesterase-1-like isoform X1 n=2 Tax=Dermacentor albipictus TaxID=60249 RepID=UPI0031FD3B44
MPASRARITMQVLGRNAISAILLGALLAALRVRTAQGIRPKDHPVVSTRSGYVMGRTNVFFNKPIDTFLGIPFAEPPLRELRFRKPTPAKPWEGIYNAVQAPFPCLQYDTFVTKNITVDASNSTEDCLYLNVWTPALHCNTIENCGAKSVIVFLHGGGFDTGGNSYFFYDGTQLAALGDVVVVVPNYRLGVFGFLSAGHPDAPGNMGLLDQLAALRWVRDNIVHFGGRPESVTLMGQSAGAMSVGFHMVSPLSRGLFKRAILQSGSPYLLQPASLKAGVERVQLLAEAVDCADENVTLSSHRHHVLECLRWANASALMAANRELNVLNPASYFPSYGDEFLPEDPRALIERGEVADVDVIIGTNRNEGSPFVNYFMVKVLRQEDPRLLTRDEVGFYLILLFHHVLGESPREVTSHYLRDVRPEDGRGALAAAGDAIGDFLFQCPVNYFAENLAARNRTVYMYYFDHRPSYSWWGDWLGVAHFDEFFFVFGTLFRDMHMSTMEELEFSSKLIQIWSTFARKGKVPKIRGNRWPKFTAEWPLLLNLSPKNFTVGWEPHAENCRAWERYLKVSPDNAVAS